MWSIRSFLCLRRSFGLSGALQAEQILLSGPPRSCSRKQILRGLEGRLHSSCTNHVTAVNELLSLLQCITHVLLEHPPPLNAYKLTLT